MLSLIILKDCSSPYSFLDLSLTPLLLVKFTSPHLTEINNFVAECKMVQQRPLSKRRGGVALKGSVRVARAMAGVFEGEEHGFSQCGRSRSITPFVRGQRVLSASCTAAN